MNFRVSILALGLLFVSFQNCGNVKFENVGTNKTLFKIGQGETINDVNSNGSESDEGDNENSPGNPSNTFDDVSSNDQEEESSPEYSEEELAQNTCSNGTEVGYLICHFPPGHVEGYQTLCVGQNALEAHLHHGHSGSPGHPADLLGSCEDNF